MFDDGQFDEIPPFLKNKSHLELSNFDLIQNTKVISKNPPQTKTKKNETKRNWETKNPQVSAETFPKFVSSLKKGATSCKSTYFTPMTGQ